MTTRSQHRAHLGKRGAAQRRARREGYAIARAWYVMDNGGWVDDAGRLMLSRFSRLGCYPRSPNLAAAFRHGALDFADKHGGRG